MGERSKKLIKFLPFRFPFVKLREDKIPRNVEKIVVMIATTKLLLVANNQW
jgi:hypothetical protein